MELLVGSRIALTPRRVRRREAALEAAMIGHCPGTVRLERLAEMPTLLDEIRGAGFGKAVDTIRQGADSELYHLPIPLHTTAEFHDIFPEAGQTATRYKSKLAGATAWMPKAVEDFFTNGGEKLWIVRVPETDGQDAFLPAENTRLHDTKTLQGVAVAMVLAGVGIVALPDLERLQIPANLPDTPSGLASDPNPMFVPCSQRSTTEQPPVNEPNPPDPYSLAMVLQSILGLLSKHRPDLTCLFTLPLVYSSEQGRPVVDPVSLTWLKNSSESSHGHGLRHMQFLFPYLRGPRFALQSPVGMVAGLQSFVARRHGPWGSIAARPMLTDGRPYPAVSMAQTLLLRTDPGIGVLRAHNGKLTLDDERLVVPALHRNDYIDAEDKSRFDSFRSAEVGRFLGHLRRQLQRLGDILVFNTDYRDPRPRMALEQFLRKLHGLGALRGSLPEEAFQIKEAHTHEGAMIYEIMVAPAFPIDRLYLTFSNRNGAWEAEL